MAVDAPRTLGFTEFVEIEAPRLRRALCVALGRDLGMEGTSEALSYAWEFWERVREMENPVGYLYRVGRSRVRGEFRWLRRRGPLFDPAAADRLPWVEPRLPSVISRLSENQRLAVVLRHAFDWTYIEIADLLGVGVSTVQKHEERGLHKLRTGMGVPS